MGAGGISCARANRCIAVGSYDNASGIELAMAQEWNGTTWRLLPAVSPAGNDQLAGVACTLARHRSSPEMGHLGVAVAVLKAHVGPLVREMLAVCPDARPRSQRR